MALPPSPPCLFLVQLMTLLNRLVLPRINHNSRILLISLPRNLISLLCLDRSPGLCQYHILSNNSGLSYSSLLTSSTLPSGSPCPHFQLTVSPFLGPFFGVESSLSFDVFSFFDLPLEVLDSFGSSASSSLISSSSSSSLVSDSPFAVSLFLFGPD